MWIEDLPNLGSDALFGLGKAVNLICTGGTSNEDECLHIRVDTYFGSVPSLDLLFALVLAVLIASG